MLYRIIFYYIILYYTILYHVIKNYTILYYTMLHYTTLRLLYGVTVLYSAILYIRHRALGAHGACSQALGAAGDFEG